MNCERRTMRASNRRESTPPPPPEPSHRSDEAMYSSDEHTNSAKEYEETYFPIPTRRMYRYFLLLRQKDFENTCVVRMDTLRELGVERAFLQLTSRIRFSLTFWSIEANSYSKYTLEFLSSLQMLRDHRDELYLKFQIGGQFHGVQLYTLRKWFGLNQEPRQLPQIDELPFRRELTKEKF